jgi:hypothetical protein
MAEMNKRGLSEETHRILSKLLIERLKYIREVIDERIKLLESTEDPDRRNASHNTLCLLFEEETRVIDAINEIDSIAHKGGLADD